MSAAASDADALAILGAEHELQTVVILLSVLPLSEIAIERLTYALDIIQVQLDELAGVRP